MAELLIPLRIGFGVLTVLSFGLGFALMARPKPGLWLRTGFRAGWVLHLGFSLLGLYALFSVQNGIQGLAPHAFSVELFKAESLRPLGVALSLVVDPLRLLLLVGLGLAGVVQGGVAERGKTGASAPVLLSIPLIFVAHPVHLAACLLGFSLVSLLALLRENHEIRALFLLLGSLLLFYRSFLWGQEIPSAEPHQVWHSLAVLAGLLLVILSEFQGFSTKDYEGDREQPFWVPFFLVLFWQLLPDMPLSAWFPISSLPCLGLAFLFLLGGPRVSHRRAMVLLVSMFGLASLNLAGMLAAIWLWLLLPWISAESDCSDLSMGTSLRAGQGASFWFSSALHPLLWGLFGVVFSWVSPVLDAPAWSWLALLALLGVVWLRDSIHRREDDLISGCVHRPWSQRVCRTLAFVGLWVWVLLPGGFSLLVEPWLRSVLMLILRGQGGQG